jgi:hypothetical protein
LLTFFETQKFASFHGGVFQTIPNHADILHKQLIKDKMLLKLDIEVVEFLSAMHDFSSFFPVAGFE